MSTEPNQSECQKNACSCGKNADRQEKNAEDKNHLIFYANSAMNSLLIGLTPMEVDDDTAEDIVMTSWEIAEKMLEQSYIIREEKGLL